MQKVGGHVGANEKVGIKTRDVFKEYFLTFYYHSLYISLQEWQNIHKTMFTTTLVSYSAAFGLCINEVIKANMS